MSFTVLTTIEGFFSAFSMSGYLTSKHFPRLKLAWACTSARSPRFNVDLPTIRTWLLVLACNSTFRCLQLQPVAAPATADLIDIGPSYAGALMGISNTVATLPGVAANLLAGEMLATVDGDWRPVFGTAVAVVFGGLVAFLALAKGHMVLVPSPDGGVCKSKGSKEDEEELSHE